MSAARLSANASTRVFAASTRSYSTFSSRVARSTNNTRTALQNASLLTSARNSSNLLASNSTPISFGVSTRLFSSTMTAPGKFNQLQLPSSHQYGSKNNVATAASIPRAKVAPVPAARVASCIGRSQPTWSAQQTTVSLWRLGSDAHKQGSERHFLCLDARVSDKDLSVRPLL